MSDPKLEITALVREFMTAMGQTPDYELQLRLLAEEADELDQAAHDLVNSTSLETMSSFLKEAADFMYVMVGFIIAAEVAVENGHERRQPTDEEIVSLMKVRLGEAHIKAAVSLFMPDAMLFDAVKRVHESNMSKLGEDGKPIKNEHGKVLKGPNYKAPDLSDMAEVALGNWELALLLRELADKAAA